MLTKLEHILLLMRFHPQAAVFKWNTIQASLGKSAVKRPSRITANPQRVCCDAGAAIFVLR
jgi:hypothetical protein